jgi:AcrR family transcriptional regulator
MRLDKVKAKTALLVAGKTQSDLAESLELSRRWVGAAFNGGSISDIAAALGVSVESLMEQ